MNKEKLKKLYEKHKVAVYAAGAGAGILLITVVNECILHVPGKSSLKIHVDPKSGALVITEYKLPRFRNWDKFRKCDRNWACNFKDLGLARSFANSMLDMVNEMEVK